MKPKVTVAAGDGGVRVQFEGPMNEDVKPVLTELAEGLGDPVVIDLSGMTMINSCGTREWVVFLKGITQGRSVSLERCPDEFVHNLNCVPALAGDIPLLSVFRAYECESCSFQDMVLLQADKDFAPGRLPQDADGPCPQCGEKSFAPEVEAEEFFHFLMG